MAKRLHDIEGRTLEGGGQLVRMAIGLSALSGTPIRITNIRGGRPRGGGLKTQHLTAVNWLEKVCSGDALGANVGCKVLEFTPSIKDDGPVCNTNIWNITMNSPGAITLILQAILPYVIFSGQWTDIVTITITGGTNVSFSPSYDYVVKVLLPTLARIGLPPIEAVLNKRGWNTGQAEVGSVTFKITPLERGSTLAGFSLSDPGRVAHIRATILGPRECRTAFMESLRAYLGPKGYHSIHADFESSNHRQRIYLLLVAETRNRHLLGRDLLYDRRVKSSLLSLIPGLVKQVADDLLREIATGGCVDSYMQDQLVIYQALAKGRTFVDAGIRGQPSLHTRTAWWIVEELLSVRFDTIRLGECSGIGHVVEANVKNYNTELDRENVAVDKLGKQFEKLFREETERSVHK